MFCRNVEIYLQVNLPQNLRNGYTYTFCVFAPYKEFKVPVRFCSFHVCENFQMKCQYYIMY